MLDPYRMIVVNIIASALVFFGILFYRFIYPKKKINLFVLLIIISLLPLISMLRSGTYQSGDLSLHAVRAMSYYNIIFNEHSLPRWTPEFYAGFGDPYASFAYPLPYIIISVLHFLGFSFLISIKLLLAISFLLSGILMYIFVRKDLGEKAAFTAGVFYIFTPVHLVNMHFQVTIAMTLSYIFLPLSLYLTRKILLNYSSKWIVFYAINIMFFILSHQIISLSFLPINIFYALFLIKHNDIKKIKIVNYFISFFLGLLISSFYWLPAIIESRFTQQALIKNEWLLFSSLPQLLYSPWRYGLLFQGHKGEISLIIGYTQVLIIILGVILILFKKNLIIKLKIHLKFFLIICLILIILMLPLFKEFWYFIPFLKSFQFTSRLLVATAFCTAIIAGVVIKIIDKNWFMIFICTLTIFYTILNWGNRMSIPQINDNVLKKENDIWPRLGIVRLEPSSPIWANLNKNLYSIKRTSNLNILEGNVSVKEISRSSINHKYLINVRSSAAKIRENTLYFPGWTLIVNNSERKINFQDNENKGIIIFNLEKGTHKVELTYKRTFIRKVSNVITIISFLFLFIFFFKQISISFQKFQHFPRLK